jgi:Ferritin-like domain
MLERRTTRRQLVAGAVGLAGAAAGAAAVAGPAVSDTPPVSDAQALSKALEVERLLVLAYRRVLASGTLTPDVEAVLTPLLGHELEHVSAVAGRLEKMGVNAATGPLDLNSASALLSKYNVPDSLTDLHTMSDSLKLLVDIESVAEGVYFTALATLSKPGLQRLSAQIMACEAQHWTALSGLRNPGMYVKAVPWPFVTGSS